MLSTTVLPKWANMRTTNEMEDGMMMKMMKSGRGKKPGDSMRHAVMQMRPPKLDLRKLTSDNCCDDLEEDSLLPVAINSPANYAVHNIDLGNLSDRYAKPLDSGPGYSQDRERSSLLLHFYIFYDIFLNLNYIFKINYNIYVLL